MKKHSHLLSFFLGVATTLVLLAGVTTALAVSGQVTAFNCVNLQINGSAILTEGETIKNDAGAEIPSSISYTDEMGGGNTYVPLRYLMNELHIPIEWQKEGNYITLSVDGLSGVYHLPLVNKEAEIVFQGILSVADIEAPKNGGTVLISENYQSDQERVSSEAYTADIMIDPAKGQYVAITVENLNDAPVEFRWGDPDATFNAQVPANSTVTLPLKLEKTDEGEQPLYFLVGYSDFVKPVDVSVSVVQFDIDE